MFEGGTSNADNRPANRIGKRAPVHTVAAADRVPMGGYPRNVAYPLSMRPSTSRDFRGFASSLRTDAERRLAERGPGSPLDVNPARFAHELQVHQVELELQNEHLRELVAELQQARNRYADLFDYAPVAYLMLELDGKIVEANHSASILLGAEHGDLPTRTLASFVAADDRERWQHYFRSDTSSVESQRRSCRIKLVTPGGALAYVRAHLARGLASTSANGCASVRAALVVIDKDDYLRHRLSQAA